MSGVENPMSEKPSPGATAAQLVAADPGASVWVSANAGTGKTRVLIDRITRLLLEGVRPERILCLTFTKAAAAEMATRLADRLSAWAVADDDRLAEELHQLFGKPADHDLHPLARRLFAETLDAPGGLKIRTIHSFCESLLGRFPLEAGLAPHFTVMDERTAAELMQDARDRIFAHAFDRGEERVARAMDHLAGLVNEDGFATLMRQLSFHRSRLAALISAHKGLDGAIAAARRNLGVEEGATAEGIVADACREGAFDRAGLSAAVVALAEGSAKDGERSAAIAAWLEGGDDGRAAGWPDYTDVFMRKDGKARAESQLSTKAVREKTPAAFDVLLAEQERIVGTAQRLKALFVAEATGALLALGSSLMDAYDDIKARRALLDYDDLILATRGLLTRDGGVSWVHYKLDGGLDHVLVDEAQDTSPEQWDVITALAAEFFEPGGARGDAGRTVFAVGDEKQSIYSFQGADPAAFEGTRQMFADRARAMGGDVVPVELHKSFRSTPVVLRAVDAVFAGDRAAAEGLTFAGRPVVHESSRHGQGGLVEIWPTLTPDEEVDRDPWDAPMDHVGEQSPPARLARLIADTIGGWLDRGEVLESAARPILPGDVMILVRRRDAFVEEMVRALKLRNIPVAGTDRMVLTDQLGVMDLVAVGRFVLLPEDDLNLAVVLKGPLFGFTDDDLFAFAHGREGTLWRALGAKADTDGGPFLHARERLAALLARADYQPPYEFYARILGAEGGRRAILGRLGRDAEDPIDEFLSLSLAYEREHPPSLQGFLHWLEAGGTEIKRDLEQGRGTVRVMTVHGAKGLQAPIVFLPDTCTVPDKRTDSRLRWIDGEDPILLWPPFSDTDVPVTEELGDAAAALRLQEYRRLLYVAMTRAEDRLYVTGHENRRGRSEGCWYDLIRDAVVELSGVVPFEGPAGGEGLRILDPQEAAPDKTGKGTDKAEPATVPLPDWARQPPPPEPEPSRPLAPSRPSGDAPPVASPLGGDGGARFRRGRLIHRLLQTLPDIDPVRRADAARAWLARASHGLDPALQDEIAVETMAVLDDPRFAALFGSGSRAEVPLAGVVGGRVVAGQVDRLVVDEGEVTVVDYKTNRPPPTAVEDVSAVYLAQMAAYRALLNDIYPGRAVRCVLLWTDGPRIMDLPDALLDGHAP
ncbi:MAG: double-strand break repair helicase AddA [Rhodospirillales bacterium]|nr:double-strand break repair helicase AddA [Rhodospirillales bacterium]MCW8952949.1 double-strand break repair helicase AddA [Rhodospirillales bacterium]MCW8971005.1 double-strand break repair helicase AddA [Rhodospirillales bacterium]